jgi:hypothetical protein
MTPMLFDATPMPFQILLLFFAISALFFFTLPRAARYAARRHAIYIFRFSPAASFDIITPRRCCRQRHFIFDRQKPPAAAIILRSDAERWLFAAIFIANIFASLPLAIYD